MKGRSCAAPVPPSKRFRISRSEGAAENPAAPTVLLPSVPHLGLLTLGPLPDPTMAGVRINDALVIDRYRPPALTYAGKRRRGIQESFA